MSDDFKLLTRDQLLVVRWSRPTSAAAEQLARAIEARHAELGRPLVFVVMIGPECPLPDRTTREAMQRGHARISELVFGAWTVILPGSVRQRLMQRILIGMRMASALRGEAAHHFSSAAELFDALDSEHGLDRARVTRELLDAGMLDASELEP